MALQLEFAHRWSPIADLPSDHGELARKELEHLRVVWQEQKAELEAQDAVQYFNERLLRRWAIETGLLHVRRSQFAARRHEVEQPGHGVVLVADHLHDVLRVAVGRAVGNQACVQSPLHQQLDDSAVQRVQALDEPHATLTANQRHVDAVDSLGQRVQVKLRRGEYKQRPNNPREQDGRVHEYCPPEQVASEMDRLIEMHRRHESDGVAPEVQAAWLHHRFTQIHPFQDGNGRVARTLATLVLLKSRGFPLVVANDQRDDYIDALRDADNGSLRSLVELFAKIEKQAFVEAIGTAAQAMQDAESKEALIAAMRDTFEKRRPALVNEWEHAKTMAGSLQDIAEEKLEALARDLESELGRFAPPDRPFAFYVNRNRPGDDKTHWFRYQIVETAKTLRYYANPGSYHAWVRLVLKTEVRSEILVSLHGLGREYRGIVVASACIFEKDPVGDFVIPASNIEPLTDEPFQVNYKEGREGVADRFSTWLDQALVAGLAAAHKLL